MRQKLLAVLFAITLCGVGILAELSKPAPRLTFDENGNYTGFDSIPEHYSVSRARRDGCVINDYNLVLDNHSARDPVWRSFVTKSARGENSSIRIMIVHSDRVGGGYSFQDVFFEDGLYCTFHSDSENQQRMDYGYLMELEGKAGAHELYDEIETVITWDETVTYRDVKSAMFSSTFYGKQKNYQEIYIADRTPTERR